MFNLFFNCWIKLGIILFLRSILSTLECMIYYFLNKSLNLFFTWDSVLPFIKNEISLHLFPSYIQISRNFKSSSIDHISLLIFGSKEVSHLSLHYLPFLRIRWSGIFSSFLLIYNSLLNFSYINDQFDIPASSTTFFKILSSKYVHLFLLPLNFWINSHLF